MPKSKKSTQYPFVLVGINTEKIDTKYNLSNTEKVIPLTMNIMHGMVLLPE